MYRVKKHMASKVAELKIGRKIIQQAVGSEGNQIVEALKDASIRHSSKEQAKKLKQTTYKMALKTKFMVDKMFLTVENTKPLGVCWKNLSVALLHALSAGTSTPEDLQELAAKCEAMSSSVLEIVGQHLTEKNKKLLQQVLDYYSSQEFLGALLNEPDFEAEKLVIFENLQAILELSDDPMLLLNIEVVRSAPHFADKYSSVISAVTGFWRKQAEPRKEELAKQLYDNLFKTHPEYEAIFQVSEEKRTKQLMGMFATIFTRLDFFDTLLQDIRNLGKRHVALGVPMQAFDHMWDAMDQALGDLFGLTYRKQVRKSMETIFRQLIDIMKSCYPPDHDDNKEQTYNQKIDEVQSFWEDVIEEQDQISHSLYESLFDLHPEYEDLFSGDVTELETKIFEMFNRVVMGLKDFETLQSEMRSLGKMHYCMNVPMCAFDDMWNSLDLTLLLVFGVRYNASVRQTLSNAFDKLISIMREAYPNDDSE